MSCDPENGGKRRQLVPATAERLREMIFAREDGAQIGSLPELAAMLGVGIVTVQQSARVLEHEGLLEVRRGPGGGYYGRRPDAAVLERSLAAYMRTQPASWAEALDMTSLLFNELVSNAARCKDAAQRAALAAFAARAEACISDAEMGLLEGEFQDLLFGMVNRPLFELLTRVTMRFSNSRPQDGSDAGMLGVGQWRCGRLRIIAAILAGDEELARFEADRNNRRILMNWLRLNSPQPAAITSL